jgi:hypothetical protein
MKAEITKSGQMNIFAETEIEAYALRKWGEENFAMNKTPNMLLDYSLREKENEPLPRPKSPF